MTIKLTTEHATATLSDGETLEIPFWRIESGGDGPAFMVLAAQHGNELNGCEAIRRFVGVASQELRRGVVFAVPFANILALRRRRSHISLKGEQPYGEDEGHNMNRTWPGRADGNDTERQSYALYQAVGRHCTHVLDFHSWSRFGATGVIVRRGHEECRELALASAISIIHQADPPKDPPAGMIGGYFVDTGRVGVTIELATQWAVVEKEVRRGVRAASNLAKRLGLFEGELETPDQQPIFLDEAEKTDVRAPCTGLFVESGLSTWDDVVEGQKLGHILRDDGLKVEEIEAPVSGRLQRYGAHRSHADVMLPAQHPFCDEGDLLATIVRARGDR